MKVRHPRHFIFRANAVAAGGFLTRRQNESVELDPDVITTNGQSCLPVIGGVSRVRVEPVLAYPDYIHYGICETFAWGRYVEDRAVTTVSASVADVRLTTAPSAEDQQPNVASISFVADRVLVEMESTYPQEGEPSFVWKKLEAAGLALIRKDFGGAEERTPVELDFDEELLALPTMERLDHEFLTNRQFFERQASRFPASSRLVFGKSKVPRASDGYFEGSIVKQIRYGKQVIPGNTLVQPGFGRLSFGVLLANESSRRVGMAEVSMGSDPGGDVSLGGAESNGVWQ